MFSRDHPVAGVKIDSGDQRWKQKEHLEGCAFIWERECGGWNQSDEKRSHDDIVKVEPAGFADGL